jgi:hypothetical protein
MSTQSGTARGLALNTTTSAVSAIFIGAKVKPQSTVCATRIVRNQLVDDDVPSSKFSDTLGNSEV